jgi:hypothetical protein
MSTRRQGIFWLLTVPAPCSVCERLSTGILPNCLVWVKGQLECGSESGYLHYQVVVAFSKKESLASVTRLFGPGIHAELTRSEAACAYVHKEETRAGVPFEHGVKPINRASKIDWESVWAAAITNDILSVPASIRIQSYRALRAIGADYATPIAMEREVFVFWGASGTGKSRRAWEEAGLDAYCKDPRSKFWDGYQAQRNVVFDEFRGGIDVAHILRWCDRYPVRVETKGSSRPLVSERIWFTSNVDPRLWYPELDPDTLVALIRRFNITHFN